MKAAGVVALISLGLLSGTATVAAPSRRGPPTCAAFIDGFTRAVAPRQATFELPLTITRGFFGDESGIEVRTLTTADAVEGTLKCKGEDFRRFEVRVVAPVTDKTASDFKAYEEAGLTAALDWDRAKVATVVGAMSSDAAEYLRASVQRGDTYLAGKVEYHQGDALDLGAIWTDADRTFVITSQADE